jgi:arylsulfatase A-like enzyme
VVLDTVRAANTSAYGYSRPTTPTLERLARDGALFLDATSPSTWSLPSHGSLFTGLYPSVHRTDEDHRVLDTPSPTLAEVFAHNGYDTQCFTANPHISDTFALTRGFRSSDRAFLTGSASRSFTFIYRVLDLFGVSADDKGGAGVAENVERWIGARPADGPPTFTFINFLEAHFPYHQVPDAFLARFTSKTRRELRTTSLEAFGAQFGRPVTPAEAAAARPDALDMYDAGILYSDHLLSRVVDALERSGRLDRTVLIVLADHGELVGEHTLFGHGAGLYEPGVRVPLVVRYPARVRGGARVATPVSTVGVFATALALADLEPPAPVHVGSLLPALDGMPAGEPVLVERAGTPGRPPTSAPLGQPQWRYRTYRSGTWKLAQTSNGDTFLYDLNADPEERQNLATRNVNDLVRLRTELATWTAKLGIPALDAIGTAPSGAAPVDDATQDRLRALGYAE